MREVDDALAMPANSAEQTAAIATVVAHQATYTSRVEATVRAARVPATIHGMGQAILTSLAQMQTTLDGIVDVLRYQVSLPFSSVVTPANRSRPTCLPSPATTRIMTMMMRVEVTRAMGAKVLRMREGGGIHFGVLVVFSCMAFRTAVVFSIAIFNLSVTSTPSPCRRNGSVSCAYIFLQFS